MLPLPPPGQVAEPLVADHLVVARFGDRALSCRGLFRVTAERVELVCLDAIGQRALGLDWSAAGPRITAAPPGFELPPGLIAGEIAAIFAPAPALAAVYRPAGLTVAEDAAGRRIADGSRTLVRIDYTPDVTGRWSGRSVLTNLLTGHSIEVRSRLMTPPPKAP